MKRILRGPAWGLAVIACQGCAGLSVSDSMEKQMREPIMVEAGSIAAALDGNENLFISTYGQPDHGYTDVLKCEKDMVKIKNVFQKYLSTAKEKNQAGSRERSDTEAAKRELERLVKGAGPKAAKNQIHVEIESNGEQCSTSLELDQTGLIKAKLKKTSKGQWLIEKYEIDENVVSLH